MFKLTDGVFAAGECVFKILIQVGIAQLSDGNAIFSQDIGGIQLQVITPG